MPDITMCKNEECIKKDSCYRYNAEPSEYWQSYSYFENSCNEETNYKMFWEIKVLKNDCN